MEEEIAARRAEQDRTMELARLQPEQAAQAARAAEINRAVDMEEDSKE
jgi:hypothetical protein